MQYADSGDYCYYFSSSEEGGRGIVRDMFEYEQRAAGARIVAAVDVSLWPERVNATLIALTERCERLERRVEMLEGVVCSTS